MEKEFEEGRNKKRKNDDDVTEEDQDKRTEELGDEERRITNLMGDIDLMINGIQGRYNGDFEQDDNGNNFDGLFGDK